MSADRNEVGALGYRQELKRSLGVLDLLAYGLVFIVPIGPAAMFGIVFNASHGMVPLLYLIGFVAMLFTALSYMAMAHAFPFAGSVYSYASRSVGQIGGFFSGWAMLLDYFLLPTLAYVGCAIAVHSALPMVPKPACVVAVFLIATLINVRGIETTARASFLLLAFQLLIVVLFAVAALRALDQQVDGASFSLTPFYNPAELTPSLVFGALSLAMYSFLGFDAISTLSEESRSGASAIARATMLCLCVTVALFVVQTWLAALFLPGRTSLPPGDATYAALYDIAGRVGGYWLKFLLTVPGIVLAGIAGAVTAQTATARLLFGMARDGELPRALAHVDPNRKVPLRATLLVAVISLALALALLEHVEFLVSIVCFGALLGFLSLHVSVIVHFMVRSRSRDWFRHLVLPAIGFVIVGYVLLHLSNSAKVTGGAWMLAGLVILLALRQRRRVAGRS